MADDTDALELALQGFAVAGEAEKVMQTRLALARRAQATGREEEARQHAELAVAGAEKLGDRAVLFAAGMLLADLTADHESRDRRLAELERIAGDQAGLVRIKRGLSCLADGRAPTAYIDDLVGYLAGRVPLSEDGDALVESWVVGAPRSLPVEVLVFALEWSRRAGRRRMTARVLLALDRQDEACVELRGLAGGRGTAAASAAALLLAALPADAHEERRRWCDVVEGGLGEGPESAEVRLDLATAMFSSAEGDAGRVERAWVHAEQAYRQVTSPRGRAVAVTLVWRIRTKQLRLDEETSSAAQGERAGWLTAARLPAEYADEYLGNAVLSLLCPGPLVRADCLARVGPLLARVRASSGRLAQIWQRHAWIVARQARPADAHAAPEIPGPSDTAPGWLVSAAAGTGPVVSDAPIGDETLRFIGMALRARPDRADALLDWLTAREEIGDVDAVLGLLERAGRSDASIPTLRYVERLRGRATGPTFATLRGQIQSLQTSRILTDDASLRRVIDELQAVARTPAERVEALWHLGVFHMRGARAGERASAVAAREALTAALGLVEEHAVDELRFMVLLSLGNAWREGPERDLERAIARYDAAAAMPVPDRGAATLWKVLADALIARNGPGDAARARELLARALKIRDRGWLRAETLLSLADAELLGVPEAASASRRRALSRLEEALPHADVNLRTGIAERILVVAAALLRGEAGDRTAIAAQDRVATEVPGLASRAHEIRTFASHAPDGDEERDILGLVTTPAFTTYMRATMPMYPERIDTRILASRGVDPADRAKLVEDLRREVPGTAELLATVEALAQETDQAARPGAVLAQAEILAYLAVRGVDSAARARALADQAEPLIMGIEDPRARSCLLLQLAGVWAPEEHATHPVRDFTRSAGLCQRVLGAAPAGSTLASDATGMLARATRYRTDGDPLNFWIRAAALYEDKIRQCARRGDHFGAEQAEANLEEVRMAIGHGGEAFNLERSIERLRRIVAGQENTNPTHLCALARDLTLWGCKHRGPPAEEALAAGQEAFAALFERYPQRALGTLDDAENYQIMGRAAQAQRAGDWTMAISLWRRRLAAKSPAAEASRWAVTAHNLADTLIRARRGFDEALEAVDLAAQALSVRATLGNQIHLWETHHLLGDAARVALELGGPRVCGSGRGLGLWHQGRAALTGALQVARGLGGGERLFRSGFVLALLARLTAARALLTTAADEAWKAIDEARPYLLHVEEDAAREAAVLVELAAQLAERYAEDGVVGEVAGCAFVLGGEAAWSVSRWLTRAAGCTQRRLVARWRRPAGVSLSTWSEWVEAARSGDPLRISPALAVVRSECAEFLSGEPSLAGLEAWLSAAPESAGFVVVPARDGYLAAIYEVTDELRCHVVALSAEPPPGLDDDLLASIEGDAVPAAYDEAVAWARAELVAPLLGVLARSIRRVLWCVAGPLRGLSPHDLWPGVAVTMTPDLAVRPPVTPEPTPTAIVVADPGPFATRGPPPAILAAGIELARAARQSDLRVRLGCGDQYGRTLGVACPGLIDAPPEPEGVLQDLLECKQVVILCHGSVVDVDAAALSLLDRSGAPALLELRRISELPHRLAGSTIVLLACQAGSAGPWIHRAGGFPGMLLACGARRVIAPLWPVFCDAAEQVGHTALREFGADGSLPTALMQLVDSARIDATAPRRWPRFHSLRAFVVWDG